MPAGKAVARRRPRHAGERYLFEIEQGQAVGHRHPLQLHPAPGGLVGTQRQRRGAAESEAAGEMSHHMLRPLARENAHRLHLPLPGRPEGERIRPAHSVPRDLGRDQGLQAVDLADHPLRRKSGLDMAGETLDEAVLKALVFEQLAYQQRGPERIGIVGLLRDGDIGQGVAVIFALAVGPEAQVGVEKDPAPAAAVAPGAPVFDVPGRPVDVGIIDLGDEVVEILVDIDLAPYVVIILLDREIPGADPLDERLVERGRALMDRGVIREDVDPVGIDAVIGLQIVFVVLFAQGVDAPVFAVDEKERRLVGHPVDIHTVINEVLHQAVAEECTPPVLTAVREHEIVIDLGAFFGEERVIDLAAAIDAARIDGEGLLGILARTAAADLDAGIEAELHRARLIKVLQGDGALPVLVPVAGGVTAVAGDAVGPDHIDSGPVIPKVFRVAREGDHRQGGGFADETGAGDHPAGQAAGAEGPGAEDGGPVDDDGLKIGSGVLGGHRAVGSVMDGGGGALQGDCDRLRRIVETARRGEERVGDHAFEGLVAVGGAGGGSAEIAPLAAAVGVAAAGDVGCLGTEADGIDGFEGIIEEADLLAVGGELVVGVQAGIAVVSPDEQPRFGLDGDVGGDLPLVRPGEIVGQVPADQGDGGIAAIVKLDPVAEFMEIGVGIEFGIGGEILVDTEAGRLRPGGSVAGQYEEDECRQETPAQNHFHHLPRYSEKPFPLRHAVRKKKRDFHRARIALPAQARG